MKRMWHSFVCINVAIGCCISVRMCNQACVHIELEFPTLRRVVAASFPLSLLPLHVCRAPGAAGQHRAIIQDFDHLQQLHRIWVASISGGRGAAPVKGAASRQGGGQQEKVVPAPRGAGGKPVRGARKVPNDGRKDEVAGLLGEAVIVSTLCPSRRGWKRGGEGVVAEVARCFSLSLHTRVLSIC